MCCGSIERDEGDEAEIDSSVGSKIDDSMF